MDSKITLSFNSDIIKKAKKFAEIKNISLSRLTEFLYRQIVSGNYHSLEDFPIGDWINKLSDGEAVYRVKPRTRKSMKKEYLRGKHHLR
ncbi:MAG TPA: DUF6364 family protein [Cyclobacteriaceae bacterium]|nr:DUF6364 family protein [Cyclobacteriaceae bacterium]